MRTRRLLRTTALLLAVGAATPAAAAPQASAPDHAAVARHPFDSVRATIRRALASGLPSLAVAVAKDGRIIWEEGFGLADRERGVRADAHTMYSLASISKPFTATAVMKLVERGQIHLDRPANEYLGPARLTPLVGDAARATVRRVMSHTAGLPLHYQFFYENAAYRRPSMDTTIARYAILVNPPGEVYQYSNLAYGILDHIVSRVSGQSYADYMRTEVFLPLGLTRTSVDIAPGLEQHVAQRYDAKLRRIPFYTFDHPGGSAIYSSAHDLVRFGMFHLKNRLRGQHRILADSTIDAMQQIQTPDSTNGGYGLGWSITRDKNGLREVAHTGGMPGVNTILALYPSENLAVAVLANQSGATPFRVADDIVAAVLPRYAAERAARRARDAAAVRPATPPAFPPPELAGAWTGTIRTYEATTPIALLFQPDGDVHVSLGTQLKTLLVGASYTNGALIGRFLGAIPSEEQRRHAYSILLNLRLGDGALRGQASAESTQDPVYYALTSFVELRKVADRPLTAADAARYGGTYTTPFGATIRVTTDAGKLKVEAVRSRLYLSQGDHTFIAADDPGVRLVFHPAPDGKASRLTITGSGQVIEATR